MANKKNNKNDNMSKTQNSKMQNGFLPISREDMNDRGWDELDFVYVIGDAYVDHSSFGPAIIARVLESRGYRVGIISQPDWKDDDSVAVFGKPRLGFLVSAGNMDSMVNHYTVNKKRRSKDAYTPGGVAGKRPDYATIVYCNLIKRSFKDSPIIIGGIEASLRRLGHYDYWSNKMKRSILMDSGADLLIYGMGELAIVEVADALEAGIDINDITFVRGTVYKSKDISELFDGKGDCEAIELQDYDVIANDKKEYAKSFFVQYQNTDSVTGKILTEKYGEKRYIVQNPPQRPLSTVEMDDVYELPYMNEYHPSYEALGGVPALSEIKFSLTSNRGCFGGCSFCALAFHQGRVVQTRSHESLVREAVEMTKSRDFKGYIHDVGGPTANFRHSACQKQKEKGVCMNKQCLYPSVCKNMHVDHSDYVALLRKLRAIPGVKKVFIRSGIRFDYVLADKDSLFLRELCKNHISGQLRVAPEHVSDKVLRLMGKPSNSVYKEFIKKFEKINKEIGKEQYAIPYLISSHPGSTLEDAVALAESVRDMGYMPEQVQDFYPTPSTISTVMYYTGLDPRTMEPVYVCNSPHEKAMQRALIQYADPNNYDLVREALVKTHREDLIGFDKTKCLITPRKIASAGNKNSSAGKPGSRNSSADKTGEKKVSAGKTGSKISSAGKTGTKIAKKKRKDYNSELNKKDRRRKDGNRFI